MANVRDIPYQWFSYVSREANEVIHTYCRILSACAVGDVTDLPLCANSKRPGADTRESKGLLFFCHFNREGIVSTVVILMVTTGSYGALSRFLNSPQSHM